MSKILKKSGKITAISVSTKKGEKKHNVSSAELILNYGVKGDAHAEADSVRQVSLLAQESIDKLKAKRPEISDTIAINPGDFAENITTSGICWPQIPIGTMVEIGTAELQITAIGKVCHSHCNIYKEMGDCVMPKEGVFAKVIKGGVISVGDLILVNG